MIWLALPRPVIDSIACSCSRGAPCRADLAGEPRRLERALPAGRRVPGERRAAPTAPAQNPASARRRRATRTREVTPGPADIVALAGSPRAALTSCPSSNWKRYQVTAGGQDEGEDHAIGRVAPRPRRGQARRLRAARAAGNAPCADEDVDLRRRERGLRSADRDDAAGQDLARPTVLARGRFPEHDLDAEALAVASEGRQRRRQLQLDGLAGARRQRQALRVSTFPLRRSCSRTASLPLAPAGRAAVTTNVAPETFALRMLATGSSCSPRARSCPRLGEARRFRSSRVPVPVVPVPVPVVPVVPPVGGAGAGGPGAGVGAGGGGSGAGAGGAGGAG